MLWRRHSRLRYRIRRARPEDIEELTEVEQSSWEKACDPDDMFTAAQFLHHITKMGDYVLVAEERKTGRLLGYVSAFRVPIPLEELEGSITTWYDLTDDGWHYKHQPDAQAMFGSSMGVLPEAGRSGIGGSLLVAEFKRIVRGGMEYGFLGGRLPGMCEYLLEHPEATPQSYAQLRRPDGKFYDPELRLYAEDFVFLKLLPDYFKDKESCDNGMLMFWKNPFYQNKWLPPIVASQVFKAILRFYQLQGWWANVKANRAASKKRRP